MNILALALVLVGIVVLFAIFMAWIAFQFAWIEGYLIAMRAEHEEYMRLLGAP